MASTLTGKKNGVKTTEILRVESSVVGLTESGTSREDVDSKGQVTIDRAHKDFKHLHRAALELQSSNIPVAFPTETVYGLGADATRSSAVQGIYKAKQRPSDNPLIVHVHSVEQLRGLLRPRRDKTTGIVQNGHYDHIPPIYLPLIKKFWPGPLTMIMPNPEGSVLALEVTAGLPTFGVRMPKSPIALALIQLAAVPLAAPSANASTKPSPTTAAHVKHDLEGRITTIIDGGPCQVGVESTVVDGLSDPPAILRPGGVSLEDLRECEGWQNVTIGYRDAAQGEARPRAPGMKYKHYSPKASVVLYESGSSRPDADALLARVGARRSIGIIRTRNWPMACGLDIATPSDDGSQDFATQALGEDGVPSGTAKPFFMQIKLKESFQLWDLNLGRTPEMIARGLFSALRELDMKDVDAIFVEGIDDCRGDVAAAVMNRLRKSAEQKVN